MNPYYRIIILLIMLVIGVATISYGPKINDFYVKLYENDKKKPLFWESRTDKEHIAREAKGAGWTLIIISILLLIINILMLLIT